MRKYKGLIITVVVIGLLTTIFVVANAGSDNNVFTRIGDYFKNNIKNNASELNKTIIAEVKGNRITQEQINALKNSYSLAGIEKTEDELFEKIVVDILLMDKATKNNISISDEIVNEQLETQMSNIKKDEEAYNQFKDYINSAELTENEYFELVKPIHKRLLTIGGYKHKILEPKFKEDNPDIGEDKFNEEFELYYKQYKHELFKNSNIKYQK